MSRPDFAVLDCVFDEIAEHLVNRVWIYHHKSVWGTFQLEFDSRINNDSTKGIAGVANQRAGSHGLRRELVVGAFNTGKSQQIFGETIHPICIFEDDLQEFKGSDGVWMRVFDKRLNVPLNRSKRRTQLVADIGNEVATGTLGSLDARYVMKDRNGSSSRQRRGVDFKDAPGS